MESLDLLAQRGGAPWRIRSPTARMGRGGTRGRARWVRRTDDRHAPPVRGTAAGRSARAPRQGGVRRGVLHGAARAFAEDWDGEGLPHALVDAERLKAHWLQPAPDGAVLPAAAGGVARRRRVTRRRPGAAAPRRPTGAPNPAGGVAATSAGGRARGARPGPRAGARACAGRRGKRAARRRVSVSTANSSPQPRTNQPRSGRSGRRRRGGAASARARRRRRAAARPPSRSAASRRRSRQRGPASTAPSSRTARSSVSTRGCPTRAATPSWCSCPRPSGP